MNFFKYIAPNTFLERVAAPFVSQRPQQFTPEPTSVMRVPEPIESIVDRYEANLPSIHRLICCNRELLEHRRLQMLQAEARRLHGRRRFIQRAFGTLALSASSFGINEFSQAGLTAACTHSVALVPGMAAIFLAYRSIVALKKTAQAKDDKAMLQVRLDELQGAIERESRAASRTLSALNLLRHKTSANQRDVTPLASKKAAGCSPQQAAPLSPFSDAVTPPPGSPHTYFARSRMRPAGLKQSSGDANRLKPHEMGP